MAKTIERPATEPEPKPTAAPKAKKPTLAHEVRRNLARRKLRSFLTLSGIALGAFALTVMGSLAENFNSSIGSLSDFLEEQVLVRAKGSTVFFPNGHLPVSLMPQIDRVEGVDVVVPRVSILFDEEQDATFGPPKLVFGVDIERARRSPQAQLELVDGRGLEVGDRWKIALGANLADELGTETDPVRVGDTVAIRGHDFEVVGIGRRTGTPVDDFATASISDTRTIAKEADAFLQVEQIVDEFSVYTEEGADPEEVAERIERLSDRAMVFPPETSAQELRQITALWNAIILGSALVALIVGGVAIINTMVFSVTERTREIGIKKAIGASSGDILREFLTEAALLSFMGGILGAGLGWLFTWLLNQATKGDAVVAFTVTPRLGLFVFLLSLVIGAGAGFLPARRAARIDPVRALRTLG